MYLRWKIVSVAGLYGGGIIEMVMQANLTPQIYWYTPEQLTWSDPLHVIYGHFLLPPTGHISFFSWTRDLI